MQGSDSILFLNSALLGETVTEPLLATVNAQTM